ncbi:hypothetical protein ACHAXT_006914 [Thalassiosira profunda]
MAPLLRKLYRALAHPAYDAPYLFLLVAAEAALTTMIVLRVPYTEIDWVAYMQEVSAYQAGERDYVNIRGDTGPLVYPAGFLYLYGWLKWLAVGGGADVEDARGLGGSTSPEAIRRAQWAFVVLYVCNSAVVLALYQRVLRQMRTRQQRTDPSHTTLVVWYWRVAMGLTCLSKRMHSIFVLRLFNDAPAMLLLHLAMYLFCIDAWALGCAVFSLAVSIKMNVLLFAPGLLLLLLQRNGCLLGTAKHLAICAAVQIVLGWPFLSMHPISYIKKAFEFDRIFFFEWTVNWKFLTEDVFVSKPWALTLLLCHLGTLGLLAKKWWKTSIAQRGEATTRAWLRWTSKEGNARLSPEYVVYTLFVSNYVGIAFVRTLHYQFYCWYFFSLPMLFWMASGLTSGAHAVTKLCLNLASSTIAMLGIEWAFLTFPATPKSSLMLQLSHTFLLVKIAASEVPPIEMECGKEKSL